MYNYAYQLQMRNHVFKVWVQFLGLGYYYPSTLDRSTQFGAVGYIITLHSSKSYVKSWRSVQILGIPTPSGCAHDQLCNKLLHSAQ